MYVPSPFFVGVRVVPSDAVIVVVSGFVSVTLTECYQHQHPELLHNNP